MADKYFLLSVDVEKYANLGLTTDSLANILKQLIDYGNVEEYRTIEEMALKLKISNEIVREVIPSEVKAIYDLVNFTSNERAKIVVEENLKLKQIVKENKEIVNKVQSFLSAICAKGDIQ